MNDIVFLDSEKEPNEIRFPAVMVIPFSKTGEPVTTTKSGIRILGRVPGSGLVRRFFAKEELAKKLLDEKIEAGTILSITAEEKPVANRDDAGKFIGWEYQYYIRQYFVRRRPGVKEEMENTPAAMGSMGAMGAMSSMNGIARSGGANAGKTAYEGRQEKEQARKEVMPETMSADDLLENVPFLTSSLKKSFG